MITILTTIEVQPGREQDLEALWRQTHPQLERHPGLRTDRLLRDTGQRRRYVVFHEWENREQFDAFVRASGMVWLVDETEIWLSPPTWSYLETVEEMAPSA